MLDNIMNCTCNVLDTNRKTIFNAKEAYTIFSYVYRQNECRCIICKLELIYKKHEYCILTSKGEDRRNYDLDHMLSYSGYNNNCLQHNIVPICKLCNNTKGSNYIYIDFVVTYLLMSKQYYKTNIKEKIWSKLETIDFLKKNPFCVAYSEFITNELTPLAKLHQLKLVRKYFYDNNICEPIYDLIFSNNDFYLASNSTNQKYLFFNEDSYVLSIEFIIINIVMRKFNITNQLYIYDALEYLKELKGYIYFSDFFTNEKNLGDITNKILEIKTYFYNINFGWEPIDDVIILGNNNFTFKNNIKEIRPDVLNIIPPTI